MNAAPSTLNAQPATEGRAGPLVVMPCDKPGKVWLGYATGEGGEFDLAEVAARLERTAELENYFRAKF